MADELVFAVQGSQAERAEAVTFADVGLREREHLQEWVIQNPEILGSGVMVVTFEFDRWIAANGPAPTDRFDVLGLDQSGRLVIAELKRDRAPDSVTMQALNYAAMVSRFGTDTLADAYASSRHSEVDNAVDALQLLQQWAPALSDETLRTPRVALIASDFGPTVTNLALFLYENGIDITLTRVQPYRTSDGTLVLTVSRILPVPNAEDFMIKPRSATPARTPAARSLTEWDWDAYAASFTPQRVALARDIFDRLAAAITQRGFPWVPKFRKGYIAFQRAGGYNVIAIDLMWMRPIRVWVRLSDDPIEFGLENPYPQLELIWREPFGEWGWHVDAPSDLSDLTPLLEVAARFHG